MPLEAIAQDPSPAAQVPVRRPLVVAVNMGYGHLRAARPLAEELGTKVHDADGPELADAHEAEIWERTRRFYEFTTRASTLPWLGGPLHALVEAFTSIPHLHPWRDRSGRSLGTRGLARLVEDGLGAGLAARLRAERQPLLTTFYAPAIAADWAGCDDIFCVVTDSDINRVWAPIDPPKSRIRYLVPSLRAGRRLESYGVRRANITFTGFPLPAELLGGPELPALKANLARRIARLDPEGRFREDCREEVELLLGPPPSGAAPPEADSRSPLVVFTVGGAGAQAGLAGRLLPSLRDAIEGGRLSVALVAGVRPKVAEIFHEAVARAGLSGALGHGLEILVAEGHDDYFKRFNALLARADVLWTKPSEMSFFGALGLPIVCSEPVGVHEGYNRRWLVESGAGLVQRDPRHAGEWLAEWLADGTLAGAAWAGFRRLPKRGLYRILEAVGANQAASSLAAAG
ncbi:MAG: hypothetical protein ACYCWW_12110 [Deltaproteobacteria bacterium]